MCAMLAKKTVPGNPQKTDLNVQFMIISVVTSCSLVDQYQHARGR